MVGNKELFHEIYNKYYSTLIRYCYNRIDSKINAEDYVQITFTLVWKKFDMFRSLSPGQQHKWLYSTLENIIKDYESRSQKESNRTIDIKESDSVATDKINDLIEEEQYQSYLQKINESINDNEKELFKAVFVNREPYKKVAEAHGKNIIALRTQISRLRKKIEPTAKKLLFKE